MPKYVAQVRDLSKIYRKPGTNVEVHALRSISLDLVEGQYTAIMGASGSGKSTLMNVLGCLDQPTHGQYVLGGQDISSLPDDELSEIRSRKIGFIFQNFNLIPTRTVLENVAIVPRVLGQSDDQQKRRAFQVLKWVGLQHRINAFPEELSGGEQQRVAIARALVNEPALILADEPTGNLDPDLALDIMNLLREINARGTTVLVATHDRELIRRVNRRTITLAHGLLAEEG